jgi:glycogen operon protein
MQAADWGDDRMHCFGMLMDGRAQSTGIRKRGEDATLLLVMNAHYDLVKFTLPETVGSESWSLLLDTNLTPHETSGSFKAGDVYDVTGRSLLLFVLATA